MGFEEHFDELRRLLVHSIILYVFAYIVLLLFFPRMYSFIMSSIGAKSMEVYSFGIGHILSFYFGAPAVLSLLFVTPIVLIMFYHWAGDALLPEERKFIARYAQVSAALFVLGVTVSFFITPRLVGLSRYFGRVLGVRVIYSADELFSTWLSLAVALGIVFQFPVLLSLLIRYGFVSKETLRSIRPIVYPIFYVLSALITPGDLLVTDVILLVLFVALYEGSIALSQGKRE